MNTQRREQLQLSILTVLDAHHGRFGLPVDAITLHVASSYGFAGLQREQTETELEYLQEKGLVEDVAKTLEPANRAWKRTAAGRDYLSERS